MRVLVAFEFSGRVRDAFLAKGHDAISCDLRPTESEGPHYQGDIFKILGEEWDLIIAHPPCTHLAASGNRWYAGTEERHDAILMVEKLWLRAPPKMAIENPVGALSKYSALGKPSQIIQPHQFGHGEVKTTCLWLKGLPKLEPTKEVDGRKQESWLCGPREDRERIRSRTYEGIAEAMAEQWG